MAKQSSPRGGTSRIRFIVVEAELQEGELAQVTQVLQNAFRTQQVFPVRPQAARIGVPSSQDDVALEHEDQIADDNIVDNVIPAPSRQPRKARPSKVPNVVNDLDPKTNPSLGRVDKRLQP